MAAAERIKADPGWAAIKLCAILSLCIELAAFFVATLVMTSHGFNPTAEAVQRSYRATRPLNYSAALLTSAAMAAAIWRQLQAWRL